MPTRSRKPVRTAITPLTFTLPCGLALLLSLPTHCFAEGGNPPRKTATQSDAPADKPNQNQSVESLPCQRVLSEAESKQVTQRTELLNKAIQGGQFADAAKLAGEIVAIRKRSQGATHW